MIHAYRYRKGCIVAVSHNQRNLPDGHEWTNEWPLVWQLLYTYKHSSIQNHSLPPQPSFQQFVPASLLAAMDIPVQRQQFHFVAVVNDGEIALSPGIFEVSPVIRRQAVAEAQREQAGTTIRLFINIPSTVQDLRVVEEYVLRAEQNICPPPPEMDVPTLMTVAELAMELDIPRVADLVTSDICQVLERDRRDVRDNPWVALCQLAKKRNDEMFYGNIAWCFLNATRATRSQKEALWAYQTGQLIYEETGYPRPWTYGLYLCVAWGAFGHPNASNIPGAMRSAVQSCQMELRNLMKRLKTPQLCEEHNPRVCVGRDVRQRCVEYWKAVWVLAYQIARSDIHAEYGGTTLGGVKRDVLRMLHLIVLALQNITQTPPARPVSPECNLQRLHASNGWLLEEQDRVRSIIDYLRRKDDFTTKLRNEGLQKL